MTDSSPSEDDHRRKRLLAVAGLLLAGLAALVVIPVVYGLSYSGRVYPGVSAGGVDLGGLTPEEAAAASADALAHDDPVTLVDPGDPANADDDRSWTYARGDLGLGLDGLAAADAAYLAGREETNPVAAWMAPLLLRVRGLDVVPLVPMDEDTMRAALAEFAPEVDVAPRDANLELDEGELVDAPALPGRQLDIEGTLARLTELPREPGPLTVEIATSGTAPRLGDMQSVSAAYRKIVSGPVLLTFRPDFEHVVELELLESWVSLQDLPNAAGAPIPSIVFDEAAMRAYVEPLAAQLDRPAREARFEYDLNTGTVSLRKRSETGYEVDPAGTAKAIIAAAYTGPRVAEVAMHVTLPSVTSRTIDYGSEGYTELGSAATRIAGAPEGRVHNILVAADRLNGLVVRPGEEFSFNEALGPVTEAEGYKMAHIAAVPAAGSSRGLGGGIGQVATTAFRAAFWGGFPITERRAPMHRVGWVEPPVGLDAAAGTPESDLRFVNDTRGYLVLSAEIDPTRGAMVWKIYGKPREREVEVVGPDVTNLTPAGGLIEVRDPRLDPGTRVQIGWAREGADATVIRTVTEEGVEVISDAFVSHYEPASDVVVEGTGE
jgi:vancomycin resistance protein YoaR